jgi:tetratricopeptide (TPR) repeat protein
MTVWCSTHDSSARAVHVGVFGRLGVVCGRVERDGVEQRLGLRHSGWETGMDVAQRAACLLRLRPMNSVLSASCSDGHDRADATHDDEDTGVDELAHARATWASCPIDNPGRQQCCDDLASALWDRYQETEDIDSLHECAKLEREALDLCPAQDPGRVGRVLSLINTHWMHHGYTDDAESLEQALSIGRVVLAERVPHPDRADLCAQVALLLERNPASYDEAIDVRREELGLVLDGDERGVCCNKLALLLRHRYTRTNDLAALTEAARMDKEALRLRPPGHPERSTSCIHYASTLRAQYQHTDASALLDEAIALNREAVAILPSDDPNRAVACTNLASSLTCEFDRTGNDACLDEIVSLEREALRLRPPGHPSRSLSCGSFSSALGLRFRHSGDMVLLDEAMVYQREALALLPDAGPDRAIACLNLATSLEARHMWTSVASLLTEAIALQREAVSTTPSDHPHHIAASTRLAASLLAYAVETRDSQLIDEAIDLHQRMISRESATTLEYALACINLARALLVRYGDKGNFADADAAESICNNALLILTPGHPSRWGALVVLAHLFTYDTGRVVAALHHVDEAIASNADNPPVLLLAASRVLGRIFARDLTQEVQRMLIHSFTAAIDLESRVTGFALDKATQLQYLTACQSLGPRACWLAVRLGELDTGLQLLERVRGMMWSHSLQLRDAQVGRAPSHSVALELAELLQGLKVDQEQDTGSAPGPDFSLRRDARHKHQARVQALLRDVRSRSGTEDFMRGLPIEQLRATATAHPVVVLIAVHGECHALLMTAGAQTLESMHLSDMASLDLIDFMSGSAASMRGSAFVDADSTRIGMRVSQRPSALQRQLAKLWRAVVRPVLVRLGLAAAASGRADGPRTSPDSRQRIHWCPTGPFAFVPLHAAGMYEGSHPECCSDYVVSSYTPSLAALSRAQSSISGLAVQSLSILPIAADRAHDPTMPKLWKVREEVEMLCDVATDAGVRVDASCSTAATSLQVQRSLVAAQIVHISCHGIQHASLPLESSFCLADKNLTISELMRLDLRSAFLAFLSACETAKGDRIQPDQTVHLAAAMMFLGFKSVVATMW